MIRFQFKKDLLPHIVALVVFFLVVLVFYYPLFLENKQIIMGDLLQWEGGAHELLEYKETTGDTGLWTNSMFGGMPAVMVTLIYESDIFYYFQKLISRDTIPHPASQTFWAMVCFYILLLSFRVRSQLAIIGAIAFAFCSFHTVNIIAGHNSKGWAILYMSLVLAGVHLAFQGRRTLGFMITTLGLVLQLRISHVQITYYLMIMVVLYGLVQLVSATRQKQMNDFGKSLGVLSLAALLAAGYCSGRFLDVYEYSKHSTRGVSELASPESNQAEKSGLSREYAFSWSNGIMETFTAVIPNFCGGPSVQDLDTKSHFYTALVGNNVNRGQAREFIKKVPTYWGPLPFTAGPIYNGAIVWLLFVFATFFVERKIMYWLLACTLLSIMLSWGKNFPILNFFLFDNLPGYNKFRAASMAITISTLSLPLMGFVGLERFFRETESGKRVQKKLIYSLGGVGGFLIVVLLASSIGNFVGPNDDQFGYPDWLLEALRADRLSLLRSDTVRSLFFVIVSAGILFAYLKKRLNLVATIILLGVLVAADVLLVANRFMGDERYDRDPRRKAFAPSEADLFILQDPAISYRVIDLENPFNDAITSYHHKSVGGYHGAKLGRFQDLVENKLNDERIELINQLNSGQVQFANFPGLNMLNTKYLIAGNTRNSVIANPNSLGNGWFVRNITRVSSPSEEIAALSTSDVSTTAILDTSKFPMDTGPLSANGTIELETYEPNYLSYRTQNDDPGLAVFSEIYYPEGWVATIDGKPAEHVRVNYVLRAMVVPAGEHLVEFRFAPKSFTLGYRLTTVFAILVVISLLVGMYLTWRSRSSVELDRAG